VIVVEVIFWVAVGLLVYAQIGYPLLLEALSRRAAGAACPTPSSPARSRGSRWWSPRTARRT
jgi:hypothetical protein